MGWIFITCWLLMANDGLANLFPRARTSSIPVLAIPGPEYRAGTGCRDPVELWRSRAWNYIIHNVLQKADADNRTVNPQWHVPLPESVAV